jgi:hypothetical protein
MVAMHYRMSQLLQWSIVEGAGGVSSHAVPLNSQNGGRLGKFEGKPPVSPWL